MRIYSNVKDAVRETERDLFEMGIKVQVQTMQDKVVADNPDYETKELQAYGFQLNGWEWNEDDEVAILKYCSTGKFDGIIPYELADPIEYVRFEFEDRISRQPLNPGNSYRTRPDVWKEFLHDGKFAYTYAERLTPQWAKFFSELRVHPETRQAILNLHSNINSRIRMPVAGIPGGNDVVASADHFNMGGKGRIPCSLYYQAIRRNGKLDWIYAMRSCDFVVHFGVDIALALRLQRYVADELGIPVGMFTYFTGSLHAYHKDLKTRGIF
jgi:hypothetical protein